MSEKDRIKEGDFREWYFPIEEIIVWVKRFLVDVGYEILPEEYIGFVRPDFHARKVEGNKTYEIVGIGAQHTDKGEEALVKLAAMYGLLGANTDYILVFPPISEYLLLDFVRQRDGKLYFAIKDYKISVWLANPDEEWVWSIIGEPMDRLFRNFFAQGKMAADFILMRELSRWEEE